MNLDELKKFAKDNGIGAVKPVEFKINGNTAKFNVKLFSANEFADLGESLGDLKTRKAQMSMVVVHALVDEDGNRLYKDNEQLEVYKCFTPEFVEKVYNMATGVGENDVPLLAETQ